MKKRAIFFILILFLISGCTSENNYENSNQNTNKQDNIFCPDYDNNQDGCLSHNECEWIQEESICEPINKNDDVNNNLDEINVPDNPSNEICKKLPLSNKLSPGDKYYCLAVINNNAEFCNDLDESGNKKVCLAVINKDSSYCKELQDSSSKHVCYYQLAVISENAEFCDDIEDTHEKEQCYFNFVSNLYWWDRSNEITLEHCNHFEEPDKSTCLAFKSRDVLLCKDNINCLTFFKQDMSFCNNSPLKECIRDRAMSSKDVSICETLSDSERDDCLGDYCTHIDFDISICNKIENIQERQSRYVELAINLAK